MALRTKWVKVDPKWVNLDPGRNSSTVCVDFCKELCRAIPFFPFFRRLAPARCKSPRRTNSGTHMLARPHPRTLPDLGADQQNLPTSLRLGAPLKKRWQWRKSLPDPRPRTIPQFFKVPMARRWCRWWWWWEGAGVGGVGGMPLVSVVVVVGRHWCQWRWWDAAGVGGGGGKALVSVVVVGRRWCRWWWWWDGAGVGGGGGGSPLVSMEVVGCRWCRTN